MSRRSQRDLFWRHRRRRLTNGDCGVSCHLHSLRGRCPANEVLHSIPRVTPGSSGATSSYPHASHTTATNASSALFLVSIDPHAPHRRTVRFGAFRGECADPTSELDGISFLLQAPRTRCLTAWQATTSGNPSDWGSTPPSAGSRHRKDTHPLDPGLRAWAPPPSRPRPCSPCSYRPASSSPLIPGSDSIPSIRHSLRTGTPTWKKASASTIERMPLCKTALEVPWTANPEGPGSRIPSELAMRRFLPSCPLLR